MTATEETKTVQPTFWVKNRIALKNKYTNLPGPRSPEKGSGCGAEGIGDITRNDAAHSWCQPETGLASGPVSRQAWHPLHRDGDSIPCSMTIAFLASLPKIVAFLA